MFIKRLVNFGATLGAVIPDRDIPPEYYLNDVSKTVQSRGSLFSYKEISQLEVFVAPAKTITI